VNDRRLLLALSGVFATLAVLLLFLGVTVTPVAVGVALPFGGVAYLLWYHATGRLEERAYERARTADGRARTAEGATGGGRSRRAREAANRRRERQRATAGAGPGRGNADRARRRPDPEGMSAAEAREALGVGADAGEAEIRRAYRERVKAVHPDRGGDEETFQRVQTAYERLVG
jgi:hypothetical protein